MLTGLMSSALVYGVGVAGQKTPKFRTNFHIFVWGLLCPSPFIDPGQMWQKTVDTRSSLKRQILF